MSEPLTPLQSWIRRQVAGEKLANDFEQLLPYLADLSPEEIRAYLVKYYGATEPSANVVLGWIPRNKQSLDLTYT